MPSSTRATRSTTRTDGAPRDRGRASGGRAGHAGGVGRASPIPPARASTDAAAPEPRTDGRRTHVVDRAADYVALAAQGHTVAQIARRRRRSRGYVSIVLRLGQAIASLEPAERAALRSPRITWSLAQRLVRADTDPVTLRAQLRHALGGFSTHNVDRRKHRVGRRPAPPAAGATSATSAAAAAGVWIWDAGWFDRDPVGFVSAHLAQLVALHEAVGDPARRALAKRAAGRLAVGQSLRSLQRIVAASAPPAASAADRLVLEALAILDRKLAEAAAEIAACRRAERLPAEPAE